MSEKNRYSDAELQDFKTLILEKREAAAKIYNDCRTALSHGDSNDVQDTSPTFKTLEEGASTLSKEELGRTAERQFKYIGYLNNALLRIENKSYGRCYCPRCNGKLMSKERLRSTPHATKCVDEKEPRQRVTYAREDCRV